MDQKPPGRNSQFTLFRSEVKETSCGILKVLVTDLAVKWKELVRGHTVSPKMASLVRSPTEGFGTMPNQCPVQSAESTLGP